MDNKKKITLGKISYLNVWPIYHALDKSMIKHDLHIISGPPSYLNRLSAQDKLDISAVSSIEYARNAEKYLLIPDLSIGSKGAVRSVLLLSTLPLPALEHRTILVSSDTHTSAALLKLLLYKRFKLHVRFKTGNIQQSLQKGITPTALLAIGDEALFLRNSPLFPHKLDLGKSWMEWTGQPFIFGLWVVHKMGLQHWGKKMDSGVKALLKAKKWGLENLNQLIGTMSEQSGLEQEELKTYFQGLVFDLGKEEQTGLTLFFKQLVANGQLDHLPKLHFYPLSTED